MHCLFSVLLLCYYHYLFSVCVSVTVQNLLFVVKLNSKKDLNFNRRLLE